jgi:hypothetical protein
MSDPSFGWVDMLHSLSLGIGLRRRGDRWAFDKSEFTINDVVMDHVRQGGGKRGSVSV